MIILQIAGWFIFSCIVMSFVEHQVHSQLMHRRNFLSKRYPSFERTFRAHAIVHHVEHYPDYFTDEPVPPGTDKEIRLNVHKAPIKAIPFALVIGFFSWTGALVFVAVATLHHWIWNKIHLEMHKPENRGFSKWPAYKYLARYHYVHHEHPDKNFNVVFPFADFVLGTYVKATPAEVKEMRQLGFTDEPPVVSATAPSAVPKKVPAASGSKP